MPTATATTTADTISVPNHVCSGASLARLISSRVNITGVYLLARVVDRTAAPCARLRLDVPACRVAVLALCSELCARGRPGTRVRAVRSGAGSYAQSGADQSPLLQGNALPSPSEIAVLA